MKKSIPISNEEREFFKSRGLTIDDVQPRGAYVEPTMERKKAETGSTEFTAKELYEDMRKQNCLWTDGLNKLRRLREAGVINDKTELSVLDAELNEDVQRCLRSLRNGGNAVSNNGRTNVRSVPPNWKKPHEIPEGCDAYCSAEEFEAKCVETLGGEGFEKWKEEHSKREPKGERRKNQNDSYLLEAMTAVNENSARFDLVNCETQETVDELFVDKVGDDFDCRGPEDIGLTTVRMAIQRFIVKNHLPYEIETPVKIVAFRAKGRKKIV